MFVLVLRKKKKNTIPETIVRNNKIFSILLYLIYLGSLPLLSNQIFNVVNTGFMILFKGFVKKLKQNLIEELYLKLQVTSQVWCAFFWLFHFQHCFLMEIVTTQCILFKVWIIRSSHLQMFFKILQISQENTGDYNLGVFPWNLRNFKNLFFYGTPPVAAFKLY